MAIFLTSFPLAIVAALWLFATPVEIDQMIDDQVLNFLMGAEKSNFSVTLWAASELLSVATLSYLVIGPCIFLFTHFKPLSADSVGMYG